MPTEWGPVLWVLGAGFSKSLGGRLLPELLSEKAQIETAPKLGEDPRRALPYEVFRKRKSGIANMGDRNGFPGYWDHAEEFLDFVDTATRGNESRKKVLLPALDGASFDGFHEACMQVIAAECEFTTLVDLSGRERTPEAWQPYVSWAQGLRAKDAVITFNYDTVLEKLGEAPGTRAIGKETVFGIEGYTGPEAGVAPIYKMHGSIDWVRPVKDDAPIIRGNAAELIASTRAPLIAAPGPSKQLHCSGVFKHIWTQALDRLKRAEVVVFVGYRFPPSDAESRSRLLAALRDNVSGKGVRVHTVLGPNTGEGDTIRLRELLRSSLSEKLVEQTDTREVPKNGHFQVIVHPLYAEDFFTVFHDNMLFGHSID